MDTTLLTLKIGGQEYKLPTLDMESWSALSAAAELDHTRTRLQFLVKLAEREYENEDMMAAFRSMQSPPSLVDVLRYAITLEGSQLALDLSAKQRGVEVDAGAMITSDPMGVCEAVQKLLNAWTEDGEEVTDGR